MNNEPNITPGIYQHYKGNQYEVIGLGKDTETEIDVVIYRPCYESGVAYWVRPLAMFCDVVSVDGVMTKRFTRIETL